MRFGICAPFTDVARMNDIAFDYLEENVQRFLVPDVPDQRFQALWQEARQLPVPIEAANSLLPANLPIIASPSQQVDRQRLERYMKTALQRAEQVGIRVIVFGSGVARTCPVDCSKEDALAQIQEHLAQWCEWAGPHHVQLVLEPLRFEETNTLNTVKESGELVSRIAETGARLLVDTYHMACNGESPSDILLWGKQLAHVHVAEKQERAAPGRFGEDMRPYFAALHQAHYDQRISIECNWQDLVTEAVSGIKTLREQWASC